MWNILPAEVVNSFSVQYLKLRLDELLHDLALISSWTPLMQGIRIQCFLVEHSAAVADKEER